MRSYSHSDLKVIAERSEANNCVVCDLGWRMYIILFLYTCIYIICKCGPRPWGGPSIVRGSTRRKHWSSACVRSRLQTLHGVLLIAVKSLQCVKTLVKWVKKQQVFPPSQAPSQWSRWVTLLYGTAHARGTHTYTHTHAHTRYTSKVGARTRRHVVYEWYRCARHLHVCIPSNMNKQQRKHHHKSV